MIIPMIVILLILLFGYYYNKMVQLRQLVREGFSGIDVQLKRRHTLIPNIVETVKGYSQHEQDLFRKVTELRTKLSGTNNAEQTKITENELSASLKNIFVIAEAYPQLKADKNFLDLQKNLTEIEDQLQMARRYYNGTVRNYNIAIQSVPANLIASLFNFRVEQFFQIEYATERKSPDIDFGKA